MLRRRSNEETERKHVLLFKGDWARLSAQYPQVGPSTVIRQLVRALIRKNDQQINQRLATHNMEVSLDDADLNLTSEQSS